MKPSSLHPRRRRGLLAAVAALLAATPPGGWAAEPADPDDPAAERASLRVLDGFEATLVASEREGVVKPIQLRFDPDGRLWIAGSTVYPQMTPGEAPNDKILVLDNPASDTPPVRAAVFADGLLIPTGIELGDGGAYVGAGGELLHLRDTDGDGRADERRVVLRGFGTGDAHQTINSFSWGPSGELLMSQGLHADSRVEIPWGVEELKQAGVMRFWPRRLRLDPFWTGAMGPHNPFGSVFDRWGQPVIFAGNGHGVYHLTQAAIRTTHFLEQKWLWNQSRKFAGGDVVENSRWPAAMQGEMISGGYLQNSVERFRLTDDGGTFKVERLPPLVESTNTAFRVVDVRFGPDGALYMADWYNPVIGHYQASFRRPDRDKTHGRVWRIAPRGAAPVAWKKLGGLPAAALAPFLASAERWDRQMAKRALAARPSGEALPAVRAWLDQGPRDDHARFEALGVFADHETLDTNLLAQVATAAAPEARAYAARVVGQFADRLPRPLEWLAPLAADPHPRVRLEAVVACSYVPDPRAVETAATAMDPPADAALDYAFTQCVHALEPFWREPFGAGALTFGGASVRQAAFARAAGGSDAAKLAAARLRRIREVALDAATVASLTETVAASGGPDDLTVLLDPAAFRVGTAYHGSIHARALRRAAEAARAGGTRPAKPAEALARLTQGSAAEVQAAAWRLAGAWRVTEMRPGLERLAEDRKASAEMRRAAFDGVAGFADDKAREALEQWVREAQPREARLDAALALAPLSTQAAALAAADFFNELPADALTSVVTALVRQSQGIAALRAAIRDTPPKAPAARAILGILAGAGRGDPYTAAMLRRIAGLDGAADRPSLADTAALAAEARQSGDAAAGRAVFLRPELGCATCHSLDGAPGKIGPDLSPLGASQTVEFIIGAILDPQKEVKEGFMAYGVTAKDGEFYQGYLRGETDASLSLWDHLSHRTVTLAKAEIEETRQLGSLMPSGLADSLGRKDFTDLVRFLSGLGRP